VLADLQDAGLLDDIPAHVAQLLRTVDLDLIGEAPQARPAVLPPAPLVGHDQTIDRWLNGIEQRLAELAQHSRHNGAWLIGGKSRLTVLNWDHLEEELHCGLLHGEDSLPHGGELFAKAYSMRISDLADPDSAARFAGAAPLVVSNNGWSFHQLAADWLAFRQDVAAALGWLPERQHPGR
jgi:hypothetical protein